MEILNDIKNLETEMRGHLDDISRLELEEIRIEPEYRNMVQEILSMEAIITLPNQTMRDTAVQDYLLNREEYAQKHREYLMLKYHIKKSYRELRFKEDCIRNRRAELQSRY